MKKIFLILLIVPLALYAFNVGVSLYIRYKIPAMGKFVEIEGKKIHYIEKGSGEPIVLIHGLNGAASNFSYRMMDGLSQNHRVVAIDRPGSGYSDPIACQDAVLPTEARFVAELMQKLGITRAKIVGHSLGGAIALQLALDYPEMVSELKLLSPLTQFQMDIPDPFKNMAIRSDVYRWIYSRFFSTLASIMNEKATTQAIFPNGELPKGFGSKGGGYVSSDYLSFYYASCDLAGLENYLLPLTKRYSEIKQPVSILYGTEDRVLDPKIHGELMKQKVSRVQFQTMKGGHMLIATDAEKVNQFILE